MLGTKEKLKQTNFLLHQTEYKKRIQERPLNVKNNRINILVNDREEKIVLFYIR